MLKSNSFLSGVIRTNEQVDTLSISVRFMATGRSDHEIVRWLRQHPVVLALPWKPSVRRAERSNAIDVLCSGVLGDEVSMDQWQQYFTEPVNPLTPEDRTEWMAKQTGVVMSSDAFLPFRDNIDCAKQYGVTYVAHPGGSVRDEDIVEACDEYGITLIHTGLRLFHH
nr:bifunctional purine biosynthesis protein PURH [Haemonchus contortus]